MSKLNELTKLIVDYNLRQDQHKEALTRPTQFKKEFIREKVQELVDNERLKTIESITGFNSNLSSL